MANRQKYYFYAPTWDYAPDGPLRLGNIIPSPNRPVPALSATDGDVPGQRDPTFKYHVNWSADEVSAGKFSIFTNFLAPILGAGVDSSIGRQRTDESAFFFKKLETLEFEPSEEYIKERMKHHQVRNYLDDRWILADKKVFMVVGVKIARGARAKTFKARSMDGEVGLTGDGTPAGVPVSGRIGVQGSKRNDAQTSWQKSSDFVFAYQLVQINVKAGQVQTARVTKGAMLGSREEMSASTGHAVLYELCQTSGAGTEVREGEQRFVIIDPGTLL